MHTADRMSHSRVTQNIMYFKILRLIIVIDYPRNCRTSENICRWSYCELYCVLNRGLVARCAGTCIQYTVLCTAWRVFLYCLFYVYLFLFVLSVLL